MSFKTKKKKKCKYFLAYTYNAINMWIVAGLLIKLNCPLISFGKV